MKKGTVTKQSLKVGLVIGSKFSGVFSEMKSGLSEIGESFGDILAEAKADLAEPKAAVKPATSSKS